MRLPKPTPRVLEKRDKRMAKMKAARDVRKAVRVRDRYRCRACGSSGEPTNPVDVHHLKFRSAGGGDVASNLLCLCRICHALLHAHRIAIVGTNANRPLAFRRVA